MTSPSCAHIVRTRPVRLREPVQRRDRARTPVLREIERFTVYEPPRSSLPDRGRTSGEPVLLTRRGGVPVLSQGLQRDPGPPGNYFAHSLRRAPAPVRCQRAVEADFWETPDDPAAVELSELSESEVVPGRTGNAPTPGSGWSPEVVARLLLAVDGAGRERPLALVATARPWRTGWP